MLCTGGGVENKTYLNSEEPFIYYAEKGFEYIELDFLLTLDNQVICSHELENVGQGFSLNHRPTLEEFKNCKVAGEFAGITFEWLIEKLNRYPNVKIIFDSKEKDIFLLLDIMVDMAKESNFDIFSRFIIQFYSVDDYFKLKENYDFNTYWFTNYKAQYSIIQIKSYFEDKQDIETIVLNYNVWQAFDKLLVSVDKKIAVHTINEVKTIRNLANHGVDYIFTDYAPEV